MNNFDLDNFGLEPMEQQEMQTINGGDLGINMALLVITVCGYILYTHVKVANS